MARERPDGRTAATPRPGRICLPQPATPSTIVFVPCGVEAAALETERALSRLGPRVQVERARDPSAALARARQGDVDLVVVEPAAGVPVVLLEGLRPAGPPVVVVTAEGHEGDAVEAFRLGAADCVARGSDYAELLPAVAIEQIRAWRTHRDREDLAKRVGDLQRYTENILQNMNSALLVVDQEGRVVATNPEAERILAESSSQLRHRPVWDWFPEGRRRGLFLERTLREGVRFRGEEATLTRRDGTRIPIGVSCAPLIDADGIRLGAVALFQDLSEIEQLRRQVLQSEKMASIGQLAAGVAHEINNPAGFIDANLMQMSEYLSDLRELWKRVEALLAAARTDDSQAVRAVARGLEEEAARVDADFLLSDFGKALRESREGSERIRRIVQDLRQFSRQETPERIPADLNQCLDSTANIVWSMMKHSVVLKKEYQELPPVRCDPLQIKQVFMNLLVNAYQAVTERVGSTGETGEIRLETLRHGASVSVRISDSGVGIAPGDLHRIFDPFFTTKEVGVGTGLGLSTSFNIVRSHGGVLRVESTPSEGSTFEVTLPIEGDTAGGDS